MRKILVLVLFIMIASDSVAGMPYTFTSGTVAKSSEVNANFQYVNYGNIVVKANGVEIGTPVPVLIWNGHMTILNSKGFLIRLDQTTATMPINALYYTTTDCTGTPYAALRFIPGTVLKTLSGELVYIDKAATATAKTINSFSEFGCSANTTPPDSSFYTLTPNDPAVTGVSSATFGMPISIERR